MRLSFHILTVLFIGFSMSACGQADPMSIMYGHALPDAPELAHRGEYSIGVRTIDVVHTNQVDVLNHKDGNDTYYDRPLTLEVWYPADLQNGEIEIVTYDEVMGANNNPERPIIPFQFKGKAARDAKALKETAAYPLIIVSHGYPGTRYLLSYLCENLASKGYVVAAIDHTESTFQDATGFHSTLLNRSLDDLFVLNEIARFGNDPSSFLNGIVNTDDTGLIGYSMGGYGAINVVGAGYSEKMIASFKGMSKGSTAIEQRVMGNPVYNKSIDPRIKAVVGFAPWGMNHGVWDSIGLAGIKVPTFFISGSMDDISGYENGVKAIYDGAVNSDRYLLTYLNARHSIASNPPPPESLQPGLNIDEYYRYTDATWDQRRVNNINQHFITAFLDIQLKDKVELSKYLKVEGDVQTELEGFKPRSSIGLELRHEGN